MKYSIIVPCYKQEKLVAQALDSVLCQKCSDWEVLCADDGGPDRTGEVLDEYVRNHCGDLQESHIEQDGETKRLVVGSVPSGGVIKVVHQKNKGMAGARNAAKALATGEWFIFLDGDDMLAPFAFEVLDKCIDAGPDADLLYGGIVRYNDGEIPDCQTFDFRVEVQNADGKIPNGIRIGDFQQMVVNRRICNDIRFVGANWSEERLFGAKCKARTWKYVHTNATIYCRRVHPGQFTSFAHMTSEECKGYLDSTKEILKVFFESGRGVESKTTRGLLLVWLEWIPARILTHLDKTDRPSMWKYWFASLPEMHRYPLSFWMRMVVWLLTHFPYIPFAVVFCFLPHWLKCRGIHR